MFRKNLRLIGSTLRSRTNEMKREVLRSLEREYWPKFASGAIRPVIFRVLPLEEAAGRTESCAAARTSARWFFASAEFRQIDFSGCFAEERIAFSFFAITLKG